MRQLSPAGQQLIDDIAKRYGYSTEAVLGMLQAVINGNGRMAQFNHPEFSGSGQWMSGGMTMVSDMFNNSLKASIDKLCAELAQLVATQPDLLGSGSFQSQQQGGQQQASHGAGRDDVAWHQAAAGSGASLFVAPAPGGAADWWGPGLGRPDSTGAQNGVRYAYFAQARRLAIDVNGKVTVYDTQDHRIGGFSQQQSLGGSLGFTSQHGLIDVAKLPVVSVDGAAPAVPPSQAAPAASPAPAVSPAPVASPPSAASPAPAPSAAAAQPANAVNAAGMDIFAMIDRLAELRSRNILTEAEFNAKKTELLARL
ncbi:SHOCT domain-containing protein [Herbaspirillum sp. SJZ107]|uniref:SHOCT domain-containing protein n=1 Tax=Herbaspirillum sp. SJZ107 TaxID=2572881 RepID=UPI001150BCCE|nr:SHOCT domain-containing protein [Herbaspirillum sp. SJZ107]TQK03529.1 putative oligomerization/nucleic acid binding protein [Herbaspirillum sp. SJZ107]